MKNKNLTFRIERVVINKININRTNLHEIRANVSGDDVPDFTTVTILVETEDLYNRKEIREKLENEHNMGIELFKDEYRIQDGEEL